jgi:enolase
MMNITGGSHSDAPIAFQEFMIIPKATFTHAMQMGTDFHSPVLHDRGLSTAVGDVVLRQLLQEERKML